MRIDQVLLTRGYAAIHLHRFDLQCFDQGNFLGIGALEGGLNLRSYPVSELLGAFGSHLLQKRTQQPSTDPPGHTEIAIELSW